MLYGVFSLQEVDAVGTVVPSLSINQGNYIILKAILSALCAYWLVLMFNYCLLCGDWSRLLLFYIVWALDNWFWRVDVFVLFMFKLFENWVWCEVLVEILSLFLLFLYGFWLRSFVVVLIYRMDTGIFKIMRVTFLYCISIAAWSLIINEIGSGALLIGLF